VLGRPGQRHGCFSTQATDDRAFQLGEYSPEARVCNDAEIRGYAGPTPFNLDEGMMLPPRPPLLVPEGRKDRGKHEGFWTLVG
jgi:hypothetical protein